MGNKSYNSDMDDAESNLTPRQIKMESDSKRNAEKEGNWPKLKFNGTPEDMDHLVRSDSVKEAAKMIFKAEWGDKTFLLLGLICIVTFWKIDG